MEQHEVEHLWRQYTRIRDSKTRERLLLQYMPLVKYVAGKMLVSLPSSVEYDDLMSAGVTGLIGALERFELEKGVKFETYVLPRIKGAILDELRTLDWVPRSLRSKARKVDRAIEQLERELGRHPAGAEVCELLHIDIDEYNDIQREVSLTSLMSLDRIQWEDDEQTSSLYDVVKNPTAENPLTEMMRVESKELLTQAIDGLPEQEKLVIALYYFEDLTLREIGEILSITESRVSQIHSKAIGSLGAIIRREMLN